jgi:hypothetical protein
MKKRTMKKPVINHRAEKRTIKFKIFSVHIEAENIANCILLWRETW